MLINFGKNICKLVMGDNEHQLDLFVFNQLSADMLSQYIIVGAFCFCCKYDKILQIQITSHVAPVVDKYLASYDDNATVCCFLRKYFRSLGENIS